MTDKKKFYRLTGLVVTDFKGIICAALKFDPDSNSIIVAGENESGKTALIEAIWAVGGGAKAIPDDPVRKGQKKAVIEVDMAECDAAGNLIEESIPVRITKTIKPDRSQKLKIEGLFGGPAQTILNKIFTKVAFSPNDIIHLKGEKFTQLLAEVAGIEKTLLRIQAQVDAAYSERKDANAVLKATQARVANLAKPAKVEAAHGYEEINAIRAAKTKEIVTISRLEGIIANAVSEESRRKERITQLQTTLDQEEVDLTAFLGEVSDAREALGNREEFESDEQLAVWEAELRSVDSYEQDLQRYKTGQEELQSERDNAEIAGHTLEEYRETKRDILSSADYKVEGLEIDEDGKVRYKGILYSEASSEETMRVACEMVASQNPGLKNVFLKEASLFDEKKRKAFVIWANENGFAPWMELAIADKGMAAEAGATIIIENGEVISGSK